MAEMIPEISMKPDLRKSADRFIIFAVLILILIMATRVPLDTDLWWHLRAGEATWINLRPVTIDTFSFTRAGSVWVNHSWLAELIFYSTYRTAGMFGLSALVAGAAVLSLALLVPLMKGPRIYCGFLVIVAAVVSAPVWSARPQIFTLVLFSYQIYITARYRAGSLKTLYRLVPLFILWANLHGGYILGLIYLALVATGEIFDHIFINPDIIPIPARKIVHLAAWTCVGAAAVVVNPNGVNTWLIPFKTVSVGALQILINEWSSPDFHQLSQLPMLFLTCLILVGLGLSGKRQSGAEILPLTAFMAAALYARRNIGPFALVSLPVLSNVLWSLLVKCWTDIAPRLPRRLQKSESAAQPGSVLPDRVTRWVNLVMIVVLLFAALVKWISVSTTDVIEKYENQLFPTSAVIWIEENRPSGPMLNDYSWGGYLIWQMRDYPVFVDGRTDLYNDEILGQWITVVNAQDGWQTVLNDWGIKLIFISPTWPVTDLLEENGWRLLYQDSLAVVYGR